VIRPMEAFASPSIKRYLSLQMGPEKCNAWKKDSMMRPILPIRKNEVCYYELLSSYAKCQNQLLQS